MRLTAARCHAVAPVPAHGRAARGPARARSSRPPCTARAVSSLPANRWPGRPGVPRQLPPAPALFVGREAELAALNRLLEVTASAVAISAIGGTAGIGKTALAMHWAHRVAAAFPDGQLCVNLRGFDPSARPVPPAEALGWFLDALGVPPESIPASLEARTGLYRSLVAGKKLLVVLDNARDADQVRPLLPGTPGCLVVVTSRPQLPSLAIGENARLLRLDVLSEAEAGQMLTGRIGTRRAAAEPEAVSRLTGLCARLPLALAITAGRAAGRPGLALADLAAELADSASRLDVLDGGDAASCLRAALSWSYLQLSADAARMFRLVGLHPGPDITAAAAASLAGIALPAARQALAELTAVSLLTEQAGGRLGCHDLLCAYAREQARATDDDQARRAAVDRVLGHYLHTGHAAVLLVQPQRGALTLGPAQPGVTPENLADRHAALAWFEAEHRVLTAAIGVAAEAGYAARAWQLCWAVSDFLLRHGLWHEWAACQRIALDAAVRDGDRAGQAAASRSLGHAWARIGDYDQARAHLTESLRLCRALQDRAGQARVHQTLGWVAERQGRRAEVLSHGRQALALFRAAGNRFGQAEALNAVGWGHLLLGRPWLARQFCQEALAMNRELNNRTGEAASWDSLGNAESQLGRHDHAAECYRRALAIARELGDRYGEAEILTGFGDACIAAGQPQQARDAWQQALVIFDDLRRPEADQVRAMLAGHPLHRAVAGRRA